MTTTDEERFGPLLNVPSALIHHEGFSCRKCKWPVKRFGMVLSTMIPRMMFYACECGTVVVWEDERQPKDAKHWAQNIKLLERAGVEVVVFNGNKRPAPSFSGIN